MNFSPLAIALEQMGALVTLTALHGLISFALEPPIIVLPDDAPRGVMAPIKARRHVRRAVIPNALVYDYDEDDLALIEAHIALS